jgi:hypothetical protein
MSTRNAVQQAFDEFGREAHFEKRSGSWYRHGEEVIAVLNLQKSQYGPQYYVNQAFWLRQLGDDRYPKEHKCHLRLRLEDVLPEAEAETRRLLDLEQPLPEEQRIEALLRLLRERLRPVIERAGSLDGLRSLRAEGAFAGAAVTGPAQQVLAAAAQ